MFNELIFRFLSGVLPFPVYLEIIPGNKFLPSVAFSIVNIQKDYDLKNDAINLIRVVCSITGVTKTLVEAEVLCRYLLDIEDLDYYVFGDYSLEYAKFEDVGFRYDLMEDTREGFYVVTGTLNLVVVED